jgi:hypothetical protein
MSTASTNAFSSQIRTRVLTFPPITGTTLGTRLSGRLYKDWPPENAVFPYCIMRIVGRIMGGRNQMPQYRETPSAEFMLYDNSRAAARVDALEDMGDLIDAALIGYVDSESGLTFSVGRQRDTLPPPVDPASRHSNSIRIIYDFTLYPISLSQYAT